MILTDQWRQIATIAAKSLSKAHILTYFQKTAILSFERGILTVGIPREFFRGWIEQNAKMPILVAAREVWPECKTVEFVVDGSLEESSDFDPREILSQQEVDSFKKRKPKAPEEVTKYVVSRDQIGFARRFLNPDFTFENFIVGDNNILAHAAATAVAREPGKKYSPLFIFGGVGLGKTHLLHAIGNKIAENNPEAAIFLMSTQNFIDEVVTAVRSGKGDKIREKYRANDVFILDDIQFLAGKERTQEILFHVFNDLLHAKKQIIFSSDRAPGELGGLEERLVSRFSMGMIADIQAPDFETRLAILQTRMKEANIQFPDKILDYTAEQLCGSIRELIGVFNQMVAHYELQGLLPSQAHVMNIMKQRNRLLRAEFDEQEQADSEQADCIEEIARRTAEFFEVPLEKLKSSSRLREYVVPRQLAMWIAHKKLKEPMQKIGNYFGGRDHTSVLSGIRRVEKNRKLSTEFWRQSNELRKKLGF